MEKLKIAACALGAPLVVLAWTQWGGSPSASTTAEASDSCVVSDFDAKVQARMFVQDALKVPSSASFDRNPEISNGGNCEYRARGFVDAQNAYGVTLHQKYFVRMFRSHGKWTHEPVVFG